MKLLTNKTIPYEDFVNAMYAIQIDEGIPVEDVETDFASYDLEDLEFALKEEPNPIVIVAVSPGLIRIFPTSEKIRRYLIL